MSAFEDQGLGQLVVAFVACAEHVHQVIPIAGRIAASQKAELLVYYTPDRARESDFVLDGESPSHSGDSLATVVRESIEGITQTARAKKGRLPRHQITSRAVYDVDTVEAILGRLRIETPALFVCGRSGEEASDKNSVVVQLASQAPCDSLVLFGAPYHAKLDRLLTLLTDGPHDRSLLSFTATCCGRFVPKSTLFYVEESIGEDAITVGERHVRSIMREMSIEESKRLRVKAALGDDVVGAVERESEDGDLLLAGANFEPRIEAFLARRPSTTVGLYRRAPRLRASTAQSTLAALLPQLNPSDYVDLYEKLQSGSRWNSDFVMMLCLAAAIASLGLLQSSAAVVIGSMLLAPLMTPMMGMGLALNQGNSKLAIFSSRAIGRGFIAALGISALLGLITPGSDLTPEIIVRTDPNILDLLIAFLSGAAGAYALARPSLAGSIAGVAIATALVPPLCSAGICLAYGEFGASVGALVLLFANVLSIILAAGWTFYAMGLRSLVTEQAKRRWVGPVVYGLLASVLLVATPLAIAFLRQSREGKNAPVALAVTNELQEALLDYVDQRPGVSILYAGRTGVMRERQPVDVGIILSTSNPLDRETVEKEVEQLIHSVLLNDELNVRVECVTTGWAVTPTPPAEKEDE